MSFNLSFNSSTVDPNTQPKPVPTGQYDVAIVKSDEKPVKDNPGATYYQLDMQVLTGEHKGAKIIERLNCKNPNQQAVDIAYSTLSAICYVTGVRVIQQSSAELHGKPFKINVVKVPRADDPTKESNEIRGYFDMNGKEPGNAGTSGGTTSSGTFGAEENKAAETKSGEPDAAAIAAAMAKIAADKKAADDAAAAKAAEASKSSASPDGVDPAALAAAMALLKQQEASAASGGASDDGTPDWAK